MIDGFSSLQLLTRATVRHNLIQIEPRTIHILHITRKTWAKAKMDGLGQKALEKTKKKKNL